MWRHLHLQIAIAVFLFQCCSVALAYKRESDDSNKSKTNVNPNQLLQTNPTTTAELHDPMTTNQGAVASLDEKMEMSKQHIMEMITDDSHFTARWLTAIKKKTGMDELTMAKVLGNLICLYLSMSADAAFVTNSILVGVPFLLYFVYPEERASDEEMLIYWPCFALLTLFDSGFQSIPAWFIVKLCLFALFFLRPWHIAQNIYILLLTRQLQAATTNFSQRMIGETPTDMLSQIMAQPQQQQMPPQSLLVSPPAQQAASTITARQQAQAASSTITARRQAQAASSTITARQQPTSMQAQASAENIRTAENLLPQQRPVQVGAPAQMQTGQKSYYVDLKPRQKTNLESPTQSMYASNPRPATREEPSPEPEEQ